MGQGHLFISYSHDDSPLVDRLRRDLEAHGARIWIDHERLTPGAADWDASVRKGISESYTVIYVASPSAVRSRYVKSELGLAEVSSIAIIPFWIVGDSWPMVAPLSLGMTQHLDARGAKYAGALVELVKAVGLSAPSVSPGASGDAFRRWSPTTRLAPQAPTATPGQRVVDAAGRGNHTTIREAMRAAQPGERIIIRPGSYNEVLTLDKPLELVGEGDRDQIIISAADAHVIHCTASHGRVANLTLRQTGSGNAYGIDIAAGRLELEGCDISSLGWSAVSIHGDANPTVRHNRIHNSKQCGIIVYDGAQGLLEDNDISGSTLSGIEIKEKANPTVRRNHIHAGKSCGVKVHEQGQGLLEDNDIFANVYPGIDVQQESAPVVRGNRIHHNEGSGINIHDKGAGVFEDNEIYANVASKLSTAIWSMLSVPSAGIEISGGAPTMRRNSVRQNNGAGIHIRGTGGGVFEENDLRGNSGGAWNIQASCLPNVTKRGNLE